MNEEMEVCPKCNAVSYGNIFCNTCLENYQNKFGKSEITTMIMEMNNKRNEIKPCPFCGSEDTSILFYHSFCVRTCDICESQGAAKENETKANEAWNQRPYDYDMPAIVKKVQRMEAAINQAITDCIPLLSWIDDDDTAVQMVEHLSEVLGGALCKQPE